MQKMKCQICGENCIKKGKRNSRQIYYCIGCRKYQRVNYIRKELEYYDCETVIKLSNEGLSIRSISRVLEIPKSTVGKLILNRSEEVKQPTFEENLEEYEVDELRTFVGRKDRECWICYAINRKTKQVIDFVVGRRTKENLKRVIDSVLQLNPKKIYTDKLNSYPSLIPKQIHSTKFRGTNYIERNNLTLRTRLKRLSYRTICYSKSTAMLMACLKIYFWI